MEAFLLKLLGLSQFWIYGPLGFVAVAEGIALYYLWQRHETLHAERFSDMQKLKDEYVDLVNSVDKTIEVLIKAFTRRDNQP